MPKTKPPERKSEQEPEQTPEQTPEPPKRIKATGDLAFKKVFASVGNEDIIAGLVHDFFGFEPKNIVITNPYNIDLYQKKLEDSGGDYSVLMHTLNDISVDMADGSFVAEMQVQKQAFYGLRAVYYPTQRFGANYDRAGNKYEDLRCIYSLNILQDSYFSDEHAVKIFRLHDEYVNIPMDKDYLAIGFFELLKTAGLRNPNQGHWQKYFLGEELPPDAPEHIKHAGGVIEFANLGKKERDMISAEERYRGSLMLDRTTALMEGREQGERKGFTKGHAQGRAQGHAQGRLEVARNMKAEGAEAAFIAKVTGLSEDDIAAL